jgi:phosphatidylglycerophosphatase C
MIVTDPNHADAMVVAAFDVDGTLTTRDCVVPFLVRVAGRRRVVAASMRHPLLLGRVAFGFGGRDALKEAVVGRLLKGRPRADVDALGRRFAREAVAGWLRPDTTARLQWHRERGHSVVIVSASLRAYLEPLASEVLGGVEALLCTDVETRPDGTFVASLRNGNCRGPEKARRLEAWLAGRPATIWAYGDSSGDTELLAMAHHPVHVRRAPIPAIPIEEVAA